MSKPTEHSECSPEEFWDLAHKSNEQKLASALVGMHGSLGSNVKHESWGITTGTYDFFIYVVDWLHDMCFSSDTFKYS